MYGDMAALAFIEVTQGGSTLPVRIVDIKRIRKGFSGQGSMIEMKDDPEPVICDEKPDAVYDLINTEWEAFLTALGNPA